MPPQLGNLQLTIVRQKGGFIKQPKYTLVAYFMDANLKVSLKNILVGKKVGGNKKSTYMISSDIKRQNKKDESYCGKLKLLNKKSHQYALYDYGTNPKRAKKYQWRKTLGIFDFHSKKISNFGNWRTSNMHFIPMENEYVNDGSKCDNLRLENPNMIQLMSDCIHLEDNKPGYDKEK